MRSLLLLALAVCLPCSSCKSSDVSSGGGAATAAPSQAPSVAPAAAPVGPSLPAVGGPCRPGPDSIACAQATEVTCAGGVWRALQACRGPGGCQGVGSALHCDLGTPQAGDPCIPSSSAPRCAGKSLESCSGGKWTVAPCPAACVQPSDGGAPTCK